MYNLTRVQMKHSQSALLLFILLLAAILIGEPLAIPACADSEENYIDKATNGIVRIVGIGSNGGAWVGSGFGVGKSGEPTDVFVTNWHVVYDENAQTICERLYILLEDTDRLTEELMVPLEVVYTTEGAPDFAIVRAERVITERIALPVQNSRTVARGSTVYSLGFPGSADAQSQRNLASPESATIKDGTVSRFMRKAGRAETWVIEHSANFSGGNSGGPLITSEGIVVGINTWASFDKMTLYDEYGNEVEYRVDGNTAEFHYSVFTDYVMNALEKLEIEYDSEWDTAEAAQTTDPSETSEPEETQKPEEEPKETDAPIVHDDELPKWVVPALIAAVAAAAVIAAVLILRKKKPSGGSGAVDVEMLRLQGLSGAFASRRFMISNPMRLGRDPGSNDLIFPDEKRMISRTHCRLVKENGALYLEDLGSTRGTFCGGVRLQTGQKVQLREGSSFYLGEPSESFQIVLSSQAYSKSAASAIQK